MSEPDYQKNFASSQQLALVALRQGRHNEAERHIAAARENAEHLPDRQPLVWWMYALADTHYQSGRYPKAQALAAEALAIIEKNTGTDLRPLKVRLLCVQAKIKSAVRDDRLEADCLLREAVDIATACFGARHAEVAFVFQQLAQVQYQQGFFHESERLLSAAIDIWRQSGDWIS
jgi:tetratricopeptide (TPR) repeat protein